MIFFNNNFLSDTIVFDEMKIVHSQLCREQHDECSEYSKRTNQDHVQTKSKMFKPSFDFLLTYITRDFHRIHVIQINIIDGSSELIRQKVWHIEWCS